MRANLRPAITLVFIALLTLALTACRRRPISHADRDRRACRAGAHRDGRAHRHRVADGHADADPDPHGHGDARTDGDGNSDSDGRPAGNGHRD